MSKALLIAEKTSERETIERVYKKYRDKIPYEITFVEQSGHLLELKMPNELDDSLKEWRWENLPINPEDYGGFRYKVINTQKAKERYKAIKEYLNSGDFDFVIHAGDADQEGELLVRIVLASLKNKLPVKRFWTNDQTDGKIIDALVNLKDDDHDEMLVNLYNAALARQHSDYRVGINLSEAATLKMGIRAAIGRVKTPILSIVCQRDIDIKNFKPVTVYGVKAEYEDGFSGQMIDKSVAEEDEDKKSKKENDDEGKFIWFDTKAEAESVIENLSSPASVVKYKKEKVSSYAPKLYELAAAQIDGAKRGYDSAKTLEIIQSLYEKGYMSYPRTDCEYLSSNEDYEAMLDSASSIPDLGSYISRIKENDIARVRSSKRWVNDDKLKEAGHSALVPTTKKPDFDSLTEEEKEIYEMICRRYVAIFLPPLVQEKTELITEVSGEKFASSGKKLIDPGYSEIFGTKFDDTAIPDYSEGDNIDVKRFLVAEKTSTCPKPFTDASLIAMCKAPAKYLEDKSLKSLGANLKIGTSATRADIIKTLIERDKYMKREKGKIVPTPTGMEIYEALKGQEICKIDMTGRWEMALTDIRAGKEEFGHFEEQMKYDVASMVNEIKEADIKMSENARKREEIGTCPECGGTLLSGKSFYCSNYKDGCKVGAFKKICDSVLDKEDFLEMLSGETIEKTLKKGSNSWKQKLKYDFEEHKVVFVQGEIKETDYKCPNCEEPMKEGDRYFSCGCGFKLWKAYCGKNLTSEQIENFFENGSTGTVEGMKSKKTGKTFKASIAYDPENNGTKFEFA